MRVGPVYVEFKFPLNDTEPDRNGNVYSREAIVKAAKNMDGIPITANGENGEKVVIGFVTDSRIDGDLHCVKGVLRYGGTCEKVKFDANKVITEMEITEVSICE